MSEFNNDNYSDESIEETRRKKMDEFKMNFDKSVMSEDIDIPQSPVVPSYSDEDDTSVTSYSTDSSGLHRRRRTNEINSFSDSDTKRRIERDSKKALKEQKKEDKKIEKTKARRNKRMFKWVWLVMIVFISVILSQCLLVSIDDMLAIGRDKTPTKVSISIPDSPTIEDIAKILEDNGIIERASSFVMYAKLTSSVEGFRQGDYEIETDKDYEAIINYLQSNVNRTDIVTVQLTEGMNVVEIAQKLHEQGVTKNVQDFLDACNSDAFDEDYPFIKDIKNGDKRYYKLEGYLFPDTYDFYLNEEPDFTISRLLSNYQTKVMDTKEKYDGFSKKSTLEDIIAKSDYSMDEIITIASIIQAEAANTEDMYYISSILHNRLEDGASMGVARLNCDCTVFYPYREKKDVPETIRDTYVSKYDTNSFDGLPAGAICNPSLDAILAAVNPKDTDYYFFCHASVDDGSTPYYATTNEEHEYNLTLIS